MADRLLRRGGSVGATAFGSRQYRGSTVQFDAHAENEDVASGPPPTPFERARRHRRRKVTISSSVVALLLLAAGGVYAMLSLGAESEPRHPAADNGAAAGDSDQTDRPSAPGDDDVSPTPDDEPSEDFEDRGLGESENRGPGELAERPDAPVPSEQQIEAPSSAEFAGVDAVQLALLIEIEASERAMMAFQYEVQDAFAQSPDLDVVRDLVGDASDRGLRRLDALRQRLLSAEAYPGDLPPVAAEVRDSYIVHLDSWVDYLDAISDNPDLIMGDTTPYTIMINTTGDAFVREVARMVDAGMHPDVQRFADEIVERGFSGPSESQV